MDQSVRTVMLEMTRASDEGRIAFPQVVEELMAAGVERYHADLSRAERTYYLPDGVSLAVPGHALGSAPAMAFSVAGVEAAVRATQAGAIRYQEFCARIAAAGCVGYLVSFPGRRAVYYGRSGEMHVERFPGT